MRKAAAIREELHELDFGRRSLRSFGLVVGGVFMGIAVFILWRRGWEPSAVVYGLGGFGGALVLFGLLAPMLLRPVYRVWMGLALVLGFVMTRVLLSLVFFGVMLPIGLALRLVGKDLLHGRPDSALPTYWIEKEEADDSPKRLERYY